MDNDIRTLKVQEEQEEMSIVGAVGSHSVFHVG